MHMLNGINDVHEVAQVLAEQYNEYAQISDDLPLLEPEWIVEQIYKYLDGADLELMIENDYTRGLAMGQLLSIYFAEQQGLPIYADEPEDDDGQD